MGSCVEKIWKYVFGQSWIQGFKGHHQNSVILHLSTWLSSVLASFSGELVPYGKIKLPAALGFHPTSPVTQ